MNICSFKTSPDACASAAAPGVSPAGCDLSASFTHACDRASNENRRRAGERVPRRRCLSPTVTRSPNTLVKDNHFFHSLHWTHHNVVSERQREMSKTCIMRECGCQICHRGVCELKGKSVCV
jgi:hypothetical protein